MQLATILNERERETLDLLEASYRNLPEPWDQEVSQPRVSVSTLRGQETMYPTLPQYNRRENFSKFDLDTLFFAFYYQQGTQQ